MMPTDHFISGTIESRRWRNLMDTLLAKAAAMGMSPQDADGCVVHVAEDWVLPVLKFVTKSIISPARRSNGNEYAWKNSDILDQVEADICTVAEQLLERELGCLDDDDRHVDLVSWLTLTLQHISDMHHHRQTSTRARSRGGTARRLGSVYAARSLHTADSKTAASHLVGTALGVDAAAAELAAKQKADSAMTALLAEEESVAKATAEAKSKKSARNMSRRQEKAKPSTAAAQARTSQSVSRRQSTSEPDSWPDTRATARHDWQLCQITKALMLDPVLAPCCGASFERAAAEARAADTGSCAICGGPLQPAALVPNRSLRIILASMKEDT